MSYPAYSTVEIRRSTNETFRKADNDWSRELFNRFGNNACDARYTKLGRGEPGSRASCTTHAMLRRRLGPTLAD